jgi:glucuronosyltransferase
MNASFDASNVHILLQLDYWYANVEILSNATLVDPEIQKLLHDDTQKFDLVIVDLLLTEALLGFGVHFNCPTIIISTFGQIRYVNNVMHNPYIPSMIAHPFGSYTNEMSFLNRLENVITTVYENYMLRNHHYPKQVSTLWEFLN